MAVEVISQEEVVKKFDKGVQVVNVFATWCGPCQMLGPVLEEASEELGMTFMKVDLDQNRDYALANEVQGVPNTMIFKDGVLVNRMVGFVPKDKIIEAVKAA
ncbi:MAG: thioredoxin [Mycoplasmataceae bacterium]|nr:thioredoxin [Mycoplasmataceae bacterium]